MRKLIAAALALLFATPAGARDPVDLTELAARLLPSVVSISTVRLVDTPGQKGQAATVARKRGMGSGFVLTEDGLIATNRHVIDGAHEITVTLTNGTTLSATLLSKAAIDIALLQVQPDLPLTPITWGDSSAVKQGMPVVAIGNPLGYSSSVTSGIISALERDIRTSPYDDYIQTDAPINQGNSGGPLFNLKGEVIGVNTALQSQGDGGSIGIGFSIPSNDAQFVIARLQQFGRIKPGWVGVRVQKLTPMIADAAGLPRKERNSEGAIVTGLDIGAPAIGILRPGDIVVGVGESTLKDARTFNRAVAVLDVGSTAPFDIWRAGKRMTVEIPVGDSPDDIKAGQGKAMADMANDFTDPPDLGLGLGPITADIRTRYEISTDVTGIAVVTVDPHSRSSEAGIEPGDVIQRVQMEAVGSVREFWAQVDGARRNRLTRILLLVRGPSGERWVTLPSA
ncbi:MAG: trypsin-like peptidase domain-containing protein [Alphaproteobacteria bacterium]|nr:trypsin-like peptidase domain-containing protein [Alphaproteobacteria bacterium]